MYVNEEWSIVDMLRQGSDKVHKMQVRQFFGDDDPFSEVFRIMNM